MIGIEDYGYDLLFEKPQINLEIVAVRLMSLEAITSGF
jgi:hypothetical protein